MRTPILALLLAAAAAPALAQIPCRGADGMAAPAPVAGPPQPNQFYRLGSSGLACAVDPARGAAMAAHKQPVTYLPCLKVGAVAIADGRAKVEDVLGQPTQVQAQGLRTETRVYPIRQRSIPEPYYVVTYLDDVAVGVQLIGPPTEMPATFSSLALGDSMQQVLNTLGTPNRRCMFLRNGPETWMWQPFPIGVDVLDGRVVGFKATWPAGRPTP